MKIFQLAFATFCFMGFEELRAQESPAETAAPKVESTLKYQEGEIMIGDGLAHLKIPANLRYLNPKDTEKVLVDLWGNPEGDGTLGMLVPADFEKKEGDAWGVVITYEEDGYVKDDEADSINYNDLLKEMQESIAESNKERVKAGYESLNLVGWAAAPRYDKASHKLFWAKEIKFGDSKENTLNYNIRVLGRKGVLVLNAVSGMADLDTIEKEVPEILGTVSFAQGNRYEDFNPKADKVAAYGLAALVAGGVAAKTGLLKGIFLALLAAKKFVIIGVIAVGVFVKKFIFGRDRNAA